MNANTLSEPQCSMLSLVEPFNNIVDRFGGNAALLGMVVNKFTANMATQMQVLKACIEQTDSAGARETLHTVKGVASTVGAQLLSARAAEFELALQRAAPVTPDQILSEQDCRELEELIHRSEANLRSLLSANGVPV